MTKDINRMAREAGWSGLYMQWAEPTGEPDWSPVKDSLTVPVTMEQIERFAALVAAAEREACAKFVEEGYVRQFERPWREDLAAAIRAKENT
jgi:hypothetical protein